MTMTAVETGDREALAEERRVSTARRRYALRVRLTQAAVLIAAAALWQFGAGRLFDPFYAGTPRGIATVLWSNLQDAAFFYDLGITALEMLTGFCIGAGLGILSGALLARYRFAADVSNPFIVAINSIPRVALAPLLIVWFGIDLASKIVLAATLVYFLMFFSTLSGIRSVDRALIDVARVVGASERTIFMRVLLPGATTWIMSGLRMSLPFALIGVIVGEFLAASSGLGYRLNGYSTNYNTNGTFAMLFVMMIFMLLLNNAIAAIERRALRWRPGEGSAGLQVSP